MQDQRSKNADDEDMLLEMQSGAVNQSSQKEKHSTKITVDNNLPKEWIEPNKRTTSLMIPIREYAPNTSLLIVN